MTYILPQIQVFQIFSALPKEVVRNLNAFAFGANYALFRYSEADEKALIGLGAYDKDNDTTYSWAAVHCPARAVVDTGYVKLMAENIWAEYLALDSTDNVNVKSTTERNKVRVADLVLKSGNGFDRSGILLRDVRLGDRVRYQYTSGSTTYEGTTKVVGFEADTAAAAVGATSVKAANADMLADLGDVLDSDGNVAGAVVLLSGVTTFPGMYADGVVSDTVTIRITTGGVAGAAKASVTYASGKYSRTSVETVIETAPNYTGRLYIGNCMYVDFDTDTFVAGATYTVDVSCDYTQLTTADFAVGGTYDGTRNTTYAIEVVRGGLFTRAVTPMKGVSNSTATSTLAVSAGADFADWTGGDKDFEYILKCTTGGSIAAAKFSLWSPYDVQSNISFGASGTEIDLGSYGLTATMTQSQAENFVAGDQWVIRVNASRPQVRIYDTVGADSNTYKVVEAGSAVALGTLGLTVTFSANGDTDDHTAGGIGADGGLVKGDVFYVPVTAEYATQIRTLVLADSINANIAPTDDISLWLYTLQTVKEITAKNLETMVGDYNYVADADDGLTVYAGLTVQDPTWVNGSGEMPWLPVYKADLYVEYRALRTDNADAIHLISDITDVASAVGPNDPDNPLGQAVYNALSNSGNRGVYYMALPSDDIAGWNAVLAQAALTDKVYGLIPASRSSAVLELVKTHVVAQSTETAKRWRLAFVSAEMPNEKAVYTQLSNPNGDRYYATITDNGEGDFVLLTFVDEDGVELNDGSVNCIDDLVPGDQIRISYVADAWGEETYTEYTVDHVLSNTQVVLEAGPAAAIDQPSRVEAYHPYTVQERAEAYAAISESFYSARIYNVFPSQFSSNGVTQTGEFAAAIVAGLASSVPPQQPITNIEVNAIDDVPLVYQTFNRDQLDLMAAAGTLILMQDTPGDRVYVRHQVSTKASGGNLNETELSMIKNFDSVSYFFTNRLAPYVGKYNISEPLLNVIDLVIRDGVDYLGSMTSVGLLGPQIILDETEIVGVQQHPTLKDHAVATVNLGIPAPCNVIQLKLVV